MARINLPYSLPFKLGEDLVPSAIFPYRFPFTLAGPPPVPANRTWGIGAIASGNVWWIKDGVSTLDYKFDWSAWLTGNDRIVSANVASSGLSVDKVEIYDKVIIAWLSGGQTDVVHDVTCSVASTRGRSDDRTAKIKVLAT